MSITLSPEHRAKIAASMRKNHNGRVRFTAEMRATYADLRAQGCSFEVCAARLGVAVGTLDAARKDGRL